ncbi:tyrosine-type recombinase/integrase [Nonomuraea rhodomycinica]|uniref:tyrosine-type recombinase/integrase n=1 Tax=Nonomuraea rhodomycinica TaxID=1712872 RepID=UPI001C3761FD|nr:tyrosine-type recombinase/integrase [Nonomuraea rhodomycinica]
MFATKHGTPIERTEDWKAWKAILKQAGVRDVRVQDARHTAATLPIEQGVNIRVVQRVLGHTTVATTERYTHVSTPPMRDARKRLASALREIRSRCTYRALEKIKGPSPHYGEGPLDLAEDRGFEPRMVLPPNRISSSDLDRSNQFNLDRSASLAKIGRL